MSEKLTIQEAVDRLDEHALDLENENYHTEAGMIWRDVIPAIKALPPGRETYVLLVLGGESPNIETMVVCS